MSIFDADQLDENKDYLAELTGPGGKFDKTKYANDTELLKALAKKAVHGDRTIDQRNKEFDELREDFLKERANNVATAKLEDLVKNIQSRDNNDQQAPPSDGVKQASLDPEALAKLVAQQVAALKAQEQEEANVNKVEAKLKDRYGDNARNVIREKMNALSLTDEDIKFLAKKSPDAVLNALGLNQPVHDDYQAPPRSNVRSDSFKPTVEVRDALYYEKMRREDPKSYFSEKMSVQRLKDMDRPEFLTRYREQERRT